MPPITKKQTISPSFLDEISVQPLEKENLKSAASEKGVHFFEDQCIIRVANHPELRQKAYEYVHKVYVNEGYIKNKDSNMHISIYDALPDTITLVAEDNSGNFIGTLTLIFDSPIGLPSDLQYKKEIDRLRNAGLQVSEVISFAIDRAQRGSVKIIASLFYCTYLLAWHLKASTDIIIHVIPNHVNYYCNNLLFQKIGKEKECPRAGGIPAVLLNLPLSLPTKLKDKQFIFPLSAFEYSDQEEFKIAKELKHMNLPMSDEEFYTFFIDKTDVWEKSTTEQKDYIKRIYPIDQADHFMISRALARAVSKKYQNQDEDLD